MSVELPSNLKFVLDTDGKIVGYKNDIGGADTLFPFSSGTKGNKYKCIAYIQNQNPITFTDDDCQDGDFYIFVSHSNNTSSKKWNVGDVIDANIFIWVSTFFNGSLSINTTVLANTGVFTKSGKTFTHGYKFPASYHQYIFKLIEE